MIKRNQALMIDVRQSLKAFIFTANHHHVSIIDYYVLSRYYERGENGAALRDDGTETDEP